MSSILGTYARKNISFKEGKGTFLYTENGDKYLDWVAGIATNILGHCHPHHVKAIQNQSKKLGKPDDKISSLYHTPPT